MNIQIFGTMKCFDTKKAQRHFKERGVKFQFIDMKQKAMSKGEYASVFRAVGGLDKMIDTKCKDRDMLALIKYLNDEAKYEKVFENQHLIVTPVVRNGQKATVGYVPEIWKTWD